MIELPNELLQQIITLTVNLTDHRVHRSRWYFPHTALFINHRWSHIVQATPEAWKNVFIRLDEHTDLEREWRMIRHHRDLASQWTGQMHFDIHLKDHRFRDTRHPPRYYGFMPSTPECPVDYSSYPRNVFPCCLSMTLGSKERWSTGRIIFSEGSPISYFTMRDYFLACPCRDHDKRLSLKRLAFVPYEIDGAVPLLGPPEELINLNGRRYPIVERLTLENPISMRTTEMVVTTMSMPYPIYGLRSLCLYRISADELQGFKTLNFLTLEDLAVLIEGSMKDFSGSGVVVFHFSSVKRAALSLESGEIGRTLYRALANVEFLVLDAPKSTMWPNLLLTESTPERLTELTIYHPMTQARLNFISRLCACHTFERVRVARPKRYGTSTAPSVAPEIEFLPPQEKFTIDVLEESAR